MLRAVVLGSGVAALLLVLTASPTSAGVPDAPEPFVWADAPRETTGPARAALLIGANGFTDARWSLPGTTPSLEALAGVLAPHLGMRPVVSLQGGDVRAGRIRASLRSLREHYTQPGGTLLIHIHGRMWREADGRLALVTAGTTANADGTGYSDGLLLATLGSWLAEFRGKLGENAPTVVLVLEAYADPLGLGLDRGDASADETDAMRAIYRFLPGGSMTPLSVRSGGGVSEAVAAIVDTLRSVSRDHPVMFEAMAADSAQILRAARPELRPSLIVPRGQPALLAVPAVGLRLVVVDGWSGQPLTDAQVEVAGHSQAAPAVVREVGPGDVRIAASAPGYLPVDIDVPVTPGDDGRTLQLRLLPEFALLRASVRNANGSIPEGLRVRLSSDRPGGDMVDTPGLHRRVAAVLPDGTLTLAVAVEAARGVLTVVADDGRADVWTTELPAAGFPGWFRMAGTRVPERRLGTLTLDRNVEPLRDDALAFDGVASFAWEQALDGLATLPVADTPIALGALRTALAGAADDVTRAACRFRLHTAGLGFLSHCITGDVPGATVAAGNREADALLAVFPDDADLRQLKQRLEFATLPTGLQQRLADAERLAGDGRDAEAWPLLVSLVDDPRLSTAFRARCADLLARTRERLLRLLLADAQSRYLRGDYHGALDAVGRAARVDPDLPIVRSMEQQILDGLARTNHAAAMALPLRPRDRNLPADRAWSAEFRGPIDAPEHWFTLRLPAAGELRLTLLGESSPQRATPRLTLQVLPRGEGLATALVESADDPSRALMLPVGAGVVDLVVRPDDSVRNDPQHDFFFLRVDVQPAPGGEDSAARPVSWQSHTTVERAVALLPGTYRVAAAADSAALHWYRIRLSDDALVNLRLQPGLEAAGSELRLVAPDGEEHALARPDVTSGVCELVQALPAGEWLATVRVPAEPRQDYVLSLGAQPGSLVSGMVGLSPDTALALTPGTREMGSVSWRQPVWYAFELAERATARIRCVFTHAAGDIDLSLFDATHLREINLSTGTTDGEEIVMPLEAGRYVVRVYAATQDATNEFALELGVGPFVVPDGSSMAAARQLAADTDVSLGVRPGAPQWLRFPVDGYARVTLRARFDGERASVGMRLYGAHEGDVIAETAASESPAALVATLPDGVYHLKVFTAESAGATAVALRRSGVRLDTNHTRDQAVAIGPGTLTGLRIDGHRERWFIVRGDADPTRLLAIASAPASQTAPLLRLERRIAPGETEVFAAGDSAGADCVLLEEIDGGPAAEWLVGIVNGVDTPVEVDLRLAIGDSADSLAIARRASDEPLTPATDDRTLSGESNSPGAARVVLLVGERLHLTVGASAEGGEPGADRFVLKLLHANGEVAAGSDGADGALALDVSPGAWVLELRDRAVGGWTLQVATGEPHTAASGASNTTPDTAVTLTPRETETGATSGLGMRWYAIDLPAPAHARIDLDHDAGAELTLSLRRGGELLAIGASRPTGSSIDMRLESGRYLVSVSPTGRGETAFAITLLTGDSDGPERETARPFGPGVLRNRPLVDGNIAWYAFAIARATDVHLTARFVHANGDVDIRLTQDGDREVDSSTGTSNSEHIQCRLVPGVYLISVWNASGRGRTTYDLELETTPVGEFDEPGESALGWPNTSEATAREIGMDDSVDGRAGNRIDAWYRFDLDSATMVTLTLTFTHRDGDIDVELRGPNNERDSSTSESDREQIEMPCSSGTWYIRVYNYSNTAPNPFRLQIRGRELGAGATREEPVEIDSVTEPTGRLTEQKIEAQQMWYRLVMPADGRLQLRLELANAGGALDMTLFRTGEQAMLTGSGGSGQTVELATGLSAGQYDLRVFGAARIPFSLEWDVQRFDRAIDADSAVAVESGQLGAQTAPPGSERWFRIDVASDSRVFAMLTAQAAESAIRLRLESGSGVLLEAPESGAIRMIRETLPVGRYFLVVANPSGEELGYDVVLQMNASGSSEGRAAAVLVRPGIVLETEVSNGRPRWFYFVAEERMEITWRIDFVHARGDIDMRLFSGQTRLGDSTGTGNSEVIQRRVEPGIYFLEVYNLDQGPSPFTLRLEADGGNADREFK